MFKLFTQAALVTGLATFAFAQTPQTPTNPNQTVPNSAQSTTAQETAAITGAGQSYQGVLMDASCSAIQSRPSQSASVGSAQSADATRARTAATVPSTGIEGSASTTAIGARTTGSASTTTNSGTEATRNTTVGTTGVNNSHEGQATAHAATTPTTGTQSTAPGASPLTAYDGSTPVANTGNRSRTSGDASAEMATVREKYSSCKVTPTTSSFALMSNGQLYMIDDTTGSLRQRMSASTAGAASPDFQTVTVMGMPQGDRISVSSVQ